MILVKFNTADILLSFIQEARFDKITAGVFTRDYRIEFALRLSFNREI